MTNPTPLDYWTLAIACIGALTGVVALAAQVWSVVLAGPRIKVKVGNALVTQPSLSWVFSIDVSNVGRMPVTILEVGTCYRTGRTWKQAPVALMPPGTAQGPQTPHRLADGEAVTFYLRPAPLANAAQDAGVPEVGGYVRLATGKKVRSRKKINVVTLASL